jgi:hypothetical protein
LGGLFDKIGDLIRQTRRSLRAKGRAAAFFLFKRFYFLAKNCAAQKKSRRFVVFRAK